MCVSHRIYECSDGNYYGSADIWARFESGRWTPVDWDERSGTEWVETADGERLALEPVPDEALPPHLDAVPAAAGVTVRADD